MYMFIVIRINSDELQNYYYYGYRIHQKFQESTKNLRIYKNWLVNKKYILKLSKFLVENLI